MERLGGFPERPKPVSLHPSIDRRPQQISFEELDAKISELSLALYHPTKFLRPDLPEAVRESYVDKQMNGFKQFTQEGRERILISMMKVNFLKRLESSIDSFRLTLQRTIEKIDGLETKFDQFEAFQEERPEVDYNVLDPEVEDDDEMEPSDFLVGGKRKFHLGHIDTDDVAQGHQAGSNPTESICYNTRRKNDASTRRQAGRSSGSKYLGNSITQAPTPKA